MLIRKATVKDIPQVQALINAYAGLELMLPRSLSELYDNIRDFWVIDHKGKIIASCALHVCWENLAEIKSLAVARQFQGRGLAKRLIERCFQEAKALKLNKIFVLTYQPKFFKKFGFKQISHSRLPHKIWAECIKCLKFPDCKEIALLKKI